MKWIITSPYTYMETEEYKDFKNFLLSSSPHIYYLLMDKFLKSRLSFFFSNIISDILVSSNRLLPIRLWNR